MAKRTDYERAVASSTKYISSKPAGYVHDPTYDYESGYLAGLRAGRREKAKANNKKAGK
jgi:hypothetical protein